jgi:predicted nucleotidyltransferase
VVDAVRRVLESDPQVAFALLFGSVARGQSHPHSDLDVAIGVTESAVFDALTVGKLTSRLEAAVGHPVHVVLLGDAPPGLAYRVFRDGQPVLVRDDAAFRARLARAVVEYLDFKPVEDLFTRGVLRAGHGR